MAKKYLIVLVLAVGVATGAFAQSLWSIGGGLVFNGGSLGSGYGRITVPGPPSSGGFPISLEGSLRQAGFGAWAFVDATFVEVSVAFMGGSQTIACSARGERSGSLAILDATLLGKLPIFMGWGDIFPLLGVGFQNFVSSELGEQGMDLLDWFTGVGGITRILFGVGSDIDLTRSMFARASILGSYSFAYWKDWRWGLESEGSGGFSVTIKAGIGFRL